MPLLQVVPCAHVMPQPPQFVSVSIDVQLVPLQHDVLAPHALLHEPQLASFEATHAPLQHSWLPPHALLQVPQ